MNQFYCATCGGTLILHGNIYVCHNCGRTYPVMQYGYQQPPYVQNSYPQNSYQQTGYQQPPVQYGYQSPSYPQSTCNPYSVPQAEPHYERQQPQSEKTEFNVVLTEPGENKLFIIKLIREITGLGLADAKNLVESTPAVVVKDVSKLEAGMIAAQIRRTGAKVIIE